MNISILLSGILIFFICLCLHIAVWRWRYPKKHIIALFLIFIMFPLAFVIGYIGLGAFGFLPDNIIFFSTADWLAIYLLNFVLSLSYILSYPAIEAVSPSLAILLIVGDSNPNGAVRDDLLHVFDDEVVLEPRLKDLIEAGFIAESNGFFMVTHRGVTFVRCFMLLRSLLGLPIGKG